MTTATTKPVEYTGEFVDIDPNQAATLFAEYKAAAKFLQDAKDRAFLAEQAIKNVMGGHEHLRVLGEVKCSWTWQAKNVFDKGQLRKDHPDLVNKYTRIIPDGKRVFDAKPIGVTHVE